MVPGCIMPVPRSKQFHFLQVERKGIAPVRPIFCYGPFGDTELTLLVGVPDMQRPFVKPADALDLAQENFQALVGIMEGGDMNELSEQLREDLQDEDARYGYAEAFSNSFVAAQIKTLREDRDLSQQELGDKIGTKQSGISRLENANYSSWKVATLRKLARAFGLRLRISFEEFGSLIPEIENFNKKRIGRRRFEDDPIFRPHAEGTVGPSHSWLSEMWKHGQTPQVLDQSQPLKEEISKYNACPVALKNMLRATASSHVERVAAMQPLPSQAELRQAVTATEIHSVKRAVGHGHKRSASTGIRSGARFVGRKKRMAALTR